MAAAGSQKRTRFLCAIHALVPDQATLDELTSVLDTMCDGSAALGTGPKRPLFLYVRKYVPATFQPHGKHPAPHRTAPRR